MQTNDNKIIPPPFKRVKIKPEEKFTLPKTGSWPESHHVFDATSLWALETALAAKRPLLVRGEPGTGKSQLARAAAFVMERAFISEVVHSKSESSDLLWKFDAIGRLGDAQILGSLNKEKDTDSNNDKEKEQENSDEAIEKKLAYQHYISPGPLWWVFDWDEANSQKDRCRYSPCEPEVPKDWTPDKGMVLLIDEIDKADADLPNGLLETLGNGAFSVPYINKSIGLKKEIPTPLVIITTNEERELPPAFIRRCLVLDLSPPKEDEKLKDWLIKRAEVHFADKCHKKVLDEAADQLIGDRRNAEKEGQPLPGQAEYIDLIRAVIDFGKTEKEQLGVLKAIKSFALKKNIRN